MTMGLCGVLAGGGCGVRCRATDSDWLRPFGSADRKGTIGQERTFRQQSESSLIRRSGG